MRLGETAQPASASVASVSERIEGAPADDPVLRALPPSARKDVDLDLLAVVPSRYEAPATSAYLYYTAEDKDWTAPVQVTVDR